MSKQTDQPSLTVPVSEKRDHIVGKKDAPVTLLEYGDFECPHCGAAHKMLGELLPQAGELVRFVFRHFPLAEVHPHATHAAEAAEAAAAQGRFWEMHDALFENQDALEDEDIVAMAAKLGLDGDRVAEELRSEIHLSRVQEDFRSGIRSGVNGTPTFFINGRRHNGSWDLQSLLAAIMEEAQAHAQP
jgi:protein-disulfide isomerase